MQPESREHATTRQTPRPTPAFVQGMRDLIATLNRHHTPCEQCRVNRAVIVRGTDPLHVVCRSCAKRYRQSTPLERRRVRHEMATRDAR